MPMNTSRQLVLPFRLFDHRVKIVEALPRIVDLRVTSEHVSFLVHEAGRVELTADVHAHHQGAVPDLLRFSICLLYCLLCMAVIPPVNVFCVDHLNMSLTEGNCPCIFFFMLSPGSI